MNSVESAASLFGSDAGPDPFAALGSDEATATQSTTDDLTHSSSVFDCNDTDEAVANLFGSEGSSTSAQQWSEPTSQDPYAYDASAYSQNHGSGTSYDGQEAQGWYDEQGQWQTYQYLPTQPAETAQQYTSNQPSNHSSPYDPYAPQANVTPVPSYAPPVTQQPPAHTQQTYAPYQPSTSPSATTYTPSQVPVSSSHSAYSPHIPTAPYQQTAAEPSSSYPYATAARTSYAPLAQTIPSVPPPPAPSAAAYRPKTLNAYDPPLPPPKPSKRAVSAARSVRAASPAVGQQTYPLPPPPPLPAQYAAYAAPREVNSHSSHGQNYQNPNSWNSNGVDGHYTGGASLGSNNSRAGVQEFAQSGHPSSQYIPQSGTYTTLGSPPRLPHSGNTDETPTPRPVGGAYNNDTRTLQSQSQPQTQSAPPSQKSFGAPSHAQTYDWVNGSITSNGTGNEDDFAPAPFSAPLTSEENAQYFSGNTSPNGQAYGERAVSPAHMASQPWYNSPRTSPDSNRGRKSNATSPAPSNHTGYRSHSYDPKVVRRTTSPGNESNRSWNGSQGSVSRARVSSPSKRGAFTVVQRATSPSAMSNGSGRYTPDSYAPNLASQAVHTYDSGVQRTMSPSSVSFTTVVQTTASDPYAPSLNGPPTNVYEPKPAEMVSPPSSWHTSQPSDPYAPPKQGTPYMASDPPARSVPNGSAFSSPPAGQYAPAHLGKQPPYAAPQSGSYPTTHNLRGPQEVSYDTSYDASTGQEVLNVLSTRPPYAPSPSLLGSNDPLGRTSARIPVFSFGFGGKVVTCFHHSSSLSTGFDVALSSRQSTDIQIHLLHKIIPESALDPSSARYPGPLFSDPGSPTNSLVRTTASQVKAKKASICKYLDERADEIQRGISYLNPGSENRREADGKAVLVRLLKAMVENDGHLTGTPQIDATVRAALLPRLAEPGPAGPTETTLTSTTLSFSSAIPESYSNLGLPITDLGESPISVSTLRPSALVKIQEFLLRGERRHAYHFALDEKLWAHAMIIASSIDKEAWKEVVNEFIRSELGVKHDGPRQATFLRNSEASVATNGREWLRVAYSLFSGQGPAAVQELLSSNQLSRGTGTLQLPTPAISHVTPMSPNFPPPAITTNVPFESLSKWAETAAVMVSSPMVPDTSAALTALGDYLVSNGWVEAAHACYLLSPITSPMGGIGSPSTRLVLLGSRNPLHWPIFHKDPDPVIFSEIAEFALSLATPPKGQEPFHGLPHLQAYRLIRATSLAEIGHIDIAKRYCEAITNSLSRSSPYFTATFVDQLRGLMDRLVGAPHLDKSGSWIGGKMNKPSLDSIGGWLEGRLTKFIAGDGDGSPVPSQESARGNEPNVFSHYSTISSATTSASSSPQPTQINGNTLPGAPPRRSGSAMASYSTANTYVPIDRASSAMEYSRPDTNKSSTSSPRVVSAGAATTTFSQTTSFGQGYGAMNGHVSNYTNATVSSKTSLDTTNEEASPEQESPWWGSSYPEDSSAPTPTAAAFVRIDDAAVPESASGFISLMDGPSSVAPSPPVSRESSSSYTEEDDEEDLGFGNSKKRTQEEKKEFPVKSSEAEKAAAPERPDAKPVQAAATATSTGSSWLGRFWRRSESAVPGPVKASLGEETSFYYDKELKRWVNKKAGADAAKPVAPPPPPSRAQTASPGRSAGMQTTGSNSAPPPPARSASAVDLSVLPPSNKPPLRVRSNLVPSESSASPGTPPPPSGSGLAPPPPPAGRPKSSASKRNLRSRYVDILQEGSAS